MGLFNFTKSHQMADEAPAGGRGGFRGGFGSGERGRGRGGDRGRGRGGRGRGRGRGRGKEDKEWIPVTKLGRLVKDMKIKTLVVFSGRGMAGSRLILEPSSETSNNPALDCFSAATITFSSLDNSDSRLNFNIVPM